MNNSVAHRLAAEAVVDAALCLRNGGEDATASTSPELRQRLIETVLRDPSFTAVLFSDPNFNSQLH